MKVIEFLTIWLKEIVLVFIFISIVELVLPNGNMKKYINMIIGFLIIIVIIGPFVKLIHKDYSFARDLYKNKIEGINFEYKENQELNKIQEEQIKNFYIDKLHGEIEDLVLNTTDYFIEEIKISIDEGKESFGKLESVELILMDNQDVGIEDKIEVKEVKKVSIGESQETMVKYKELNDDKIKKTISEKYSLPKEKIKILINVERKVN